MFCSHCGNQARENTKFCTNCGHQLESSTTASHSSATQAPLGFYAVSSTRMVVMTITTFGLYHLVWFYRNWDQVKAKERVKISPFWRAFFSPLFYSDLANRVLKTAKASGYEYEYSYVWLAIAYFALLITYKLPDPGWLLGLLAFWPLLPVVKAIAFTAKKHGVKQKEIEKFSTGEVIVAIAGGIFLLLALIGTFGIE